MLPLARYRFHWRVSAPIHLPAYAGSMLRGAFGHALRRLACMTRQADCAACPLLHTCPYPGIFAPPPVEHSLQRFSQMPAPYVIEPPAWGERTLEVGEALDFGVVLCGRGLRELPLVTLALRPALQAGVAALGVPDAARHPIRRLYEDLRRRAASRCSWRMRRSWAACASA